MSNRAEDIALLNDVAEIVELHGGRVVAERLREIAVKLERRDWATRPKPPKARRPA